MRIERELMRGAGPVAVLKLLDAGEKYGYELVESLARRSGGVLDMGQSTLYPLLYNLEAKGLIEGSWRESVSGRKRRYYALTRRGRARLAHDTKQWRALATAMRSIGVIGDAESTVANAAAHRRAAGAPA
jgi:PadR family transcriptional regulator PadR